MPAKHINAPFPPASIAGDYPSAAGRVMQLRRAVITRGERWAVLAVDYDCCEDCWEDHTQNCGLQLGLELLPPTARLDALACYFDSNSREILTYRW